MKTIQYFISIFCILMPLTIFAQLDQNCFECQGNKATGSKSSAFGLGNDARGDYSGVFGQNNQALGEHSFTTGSENIAEGSHSFVTGRSSISLSNYSSIIGSWSTTSGFHSFIVGSLSETSGQNACVFGNNSKALGNFAVALGNNVQAHASKSMVIGFGGVDYPLSNQVSKSLMIGFDSDLSTLFVGSSDGEGTTGKIGIGNITSPDAKLHILSDDGEDATLFLQPSNWDNNFAELRIGTTGHSIKAEKNVGLTFTTEQAFLFNNGKLGIGTTSPDYLLDVAGDIRFTGQLYDAEGLFEPSPWSKNANGIFYDGGNVGIGTSNSSASLEVFGITTLDYNDANNAGNALILKSGDEQLKIVDVGDNDYGIIGNQTDNTYIKAFGSDGSVGAAIFLNKDGSVGIGNDDPDFELDVVGNINFTEQLLLNGEPFETNKWEENESSQLYYNDGNVGIGTNDPDAPLNINSDFGDTDAEFFKVENNGVYGSGETIIGKQISGGPVLIQQAGSTNFSNQGPTLSFIQKSSNNDVGLKISTFTGLDHAVRWVDISALTSSLTVQAKTDLILQSGGTDPIHFATNGSPDGSPNGNQDSDGLLRMEINSDGQVGIGTTSHMNLETKLTVAGLIHAKEIKVTANAGGADFVFENDYKLPGLADVESYIQTNRHLPGIPSADEMVNNGIDVGEMQVKLLQKIEELTLYVIELKKENEEMRGDNADMKVEIEKMKRR